MKLKDCLPADQVVSAPLLRTSPEESWVIASNNKTVPDSLYKFYIGAAYFSFDQCPKFLTDDQKIIFSHLGTSIDLIKTSFEEYQDLIDLMKKYDEDSYNPIKELKKVPFDREAPKHFKRTFQLLLINLYSILDSTAEALSVVLSWGTLGRASFAEIVKKIKDAQGVAAVATAKVIVSLDEKYRADITKIIQEEIVDEQNGEWFDLFKLYRDKMAHFRHQSCFFLHDNEGRFHAFLPRQWPYYFQQDIAVGNAQSKAAESGLAELLMECDIFEYCAGLYKKIFGLSERIFNSLSEAYKIKKDSGYDPDPDCNRKIAGLIRKYKFKHF